MDDYFKRDDLLGLTAGGNKTRKLEFLVADAQAKGADTLITAGGIQSNHCRLTLAAAVKKMKCILVLEEGLEPEEKPDFNGNYFLYHLLGAENVIVVPNGADLMEEMHKVAKRLVKKGIHHMSFRSVDRILLAQWDTLLVRKKLWRNHLTKELISVQSFA